MKREIRMRALKSQDPNPKLQPLPTAKSQGQIPRRNPKAKSQAGPPSPLGFGIWRLGLGFGVWEWLELGIWILGFEQESPQERFGQPAVDRNDVPGRLGTLVA